MTPDIGRRLLLIAGCALIAFGAAVAYLVSCETKRAEDEALKNATTVARLIAARASLIVEHSGQLLATRALYQDNATLFGPDCQRALNGFLKLHPSYGFVGICDRDGNFVCSSAAGAGPRANFSDRDHFKRAVATGEVTISGLIQSRLTRKKVLLVLQPIKEAERLVGVLGAELDLGKVEELLRDARLPAGTVVALLDGAGSLYASFPESGFGGRSWPDAAQFRRMVSTSPEGSARIVGADNVERLAAYARIEIVPNGQGAYVSVNMPSTALREAGARTVWDGISAYLFVVAFFLLALWMSARALNGTGDSRKILGRYLPAGERETYAYEATWQESGAIILWEAKVRVGERLVAMPSGEVPHGGLPDVRGLVKREVESAIAKSVKFH